MALQEIFVNDQIYHIYNRGTRKSKIFLDEADYRRWEELLYWCKTYNYSYSVYRHQLEQAKMSGRDPQEIVEELDRTNRLEIPPVKILAFAHMPNHFHLVLKQKIDDGITKFMHRVATAYAMYFNKRYEISGSLYEREFRAVRVVTDGQLLQVVRYVHINPAARRLVRGKEILKYPWTSLPAYLQRPGGRKWRIVDTEQVLEMFGRNRRELADFTIAPLGDRVTGELEGLTLDDDFGWYKSKKDRKRQWQEEAIFRLARN